MPIETNDKLTRWYAELETLIDHAKQATNEDSESRTHLRTKLLRSVVPYSLDPSRSSRPCFLHRASSPRIFWGPNKVSLSLRMGLFISWVADTRKTGSREVQILVTMIQLARLFHKKESGPFMGSVDKSFPSVLGSD